MYLKHVKLKNYRNFIDINVNLNSNLNIFFGNNGSGKTNFTESLLLITKGKSFRKVKREEIINYNQNRAFIKAVIKNENILIIIEKDNKKTFINEKQVYKRKVLLETFFLNSDTLFYFKNFSNFRIKFTDKLCYNVFGLEFYENYKKYLNAIRNYKKEPYNRIWLKVFKNYKDVINNYRQNFFKKIKENYNEAKDKLKLSDCLINFRSDEKRELNIIRKDKKDLSLGELKSIIFAIVYATIKLIERKDVILLIDDFNSEWDINKQKNVKNLILELNTQSVIMETQRSEDINFIIEKGEVKTV